MKLQKLSKPLGMQNLLSEISTLFGFSESQCLTLEFFRFRPNTILIKCIFSFKDGFVRIFLS